MRILPVLICLALLPAGAQALTLTGEVRWEGERRFTETVRVEPGSTLVIASGSRIEFAGGGLEVAGRLLAREVVFTGEAWQGVVLKGVDLSTLVAGGSVSGAETGIQVVGGAPRIEGVTLRANRIGIELRSKAAATVSGCRFEENGRVGLFVKDEASPAVVNNSFRDNGRFGAYLYRAAPRRFAGNTFEGNPTGLMVSHHGSSPLLEENCLTGNETAIMVDRAARPILRRNDIRDNQTGVRLYRRADPLLEENRIAGNTVGISVAFSSYPQIRRNDLAGNGVALYLEFQSSAWERQHGASARSNGAAAGAFGGQGKSQPNLADVAPVGLDGTVDARDNWWGEGAFAGSPADGGNPAFIHDGRDQATFFEEGKEYPLDIVRFVPWLAKPVWP